MGIITTILWFIVAIIVLVGIHEFGHFYAARLCNVKVLRFSIGMGKPFWSWTDKKGTEFALAPFPIGGYVKMLDAREGVEIAPEDRPYEFTQKPVLQRIAVYLAGPLANFILAMALFWVLLLQGRVVAPPVIGQIAPDSIAEQAGLVEGQRIVAIDGKPTESQQAVIRQLINRLGESGEIIFSVQYPDSDLIYTSDVSINDWLRGVESPDPLGGLGLTFWHPPYEVAQIVENSPAERAGFQLGDRIVAVDGIDMPEWSDWAAYVSQRPGQEVEIAVLRNGGETTLWVTPEQVILDDGTAVGRVGLGAGFNQEAAEDYWVETTYSPWQAFVEAGRETADSSLLIFTSIKKLLSTEISSKNLSGIITIAKVAGSSAERGLNSFLSFLAILSVNLGVLNLLPIPMLDGGQILFLLMEGIKGKPVSERVQLISYQIGLLIVASVMIFALYNDVLRL